MAAKNLIASKPEVETTPEIETVIEGKVICQFSEYGGNPLFQIRHESVKQNSFKQFAMNATTRKVAQLFGTDDDGDSVLACAAKWVIEQGAVPLEEMENCYVRYAAQMEEIISAAKKQAAEQAAEKATAAKS